MRRPLILALVLAGCVEIPSQRHVEREFAGEAGLPARDGAPADALPDAAPPDAVPDLGEPVQVLTEADLHRPRLALAVDCGPSMDQPLSGDVTRRAAATTAIGALLDAMPDADVGLVLFDGHVRRVTNVDHDDQQDIRDALSVHGTGMGRDWSIGVRAAKDLLGEPDAARVIAVLTDGPPDLPAGDPVGSAESDARASGATVFAVSLGTPPDRAPFARLAGQPARVLVATDAASLTAAITTELPAALPCAAGPLAMPPAGDQVVFLFLRGEDGKEQMLPAVADPAARPADPAFTFDRGPAVLRLTAALCTAVRGGASLLVRYGR